jgi:RNA polymerase sigma factor (sigma-70 family)
MSGVEAREDRAGSGSATRDAWIARLAQEHGDAAYRTAYRLLGDRNDAHDAVQDALTTAFRRWDELRAQEAARGWFFRILVNTCISRHRRRRIREAALGLIGIAPATRFVDPSISIDVAERVMPHLLALPIKQRTALILRFGDDRSIEEIAAAMNIGTESVKTHIKRGLGQLRTAVDAGKKGPS